MFISGCKRRTVCEGVKNYGLGLASVAAAAYLLPIQGYQSNVRIKDTTFQDVMPKIKITLVLFQDSKKYDDSKRRHHNAHVTQLLIYRLL